MMQRRKSGQIALLACALVICISFLACAQLQKEGVEGIPQEQGSPIVVQFCKKDNCSKGLESLIRSADASIHCAFYDIDLANVISALAEQSKRIEVRLVLDDESYEGAVSGPNVVIERKSSRMHNKFCIIDGKTIWMGSMNPTGNDNGINDNNAVRIDSPNLAENYEAEFIELWGEEFSGGDAVPNPRVMHGESKVENYFCPEDFCEERVVEAILLAEKSVDFMTFSFTSESIADAILLNTKAEARGVFDRTQAGSSYSQYHRLKGFGLDVKRNSGKGKLHHKVFIIDNSTVITGSYNPTGSGGFRNDENILIIHDAEVAQQYLMEFEGIYLNST